MLVGWRGGLVTGSSPKAVAQTPTEKASGYKLPAFKSDRPRFCLLEFPAGNGESRLCLVAVDDSTLYIDLNSNQDLTEKSERIEARKQIGLSELNSLFEVPVLSIGSCVHRALTLTVSPLGSREKNDPRIQAILKQDPTADSYELSVEIEKFPFQGIGAGGRVPARVGYKDLEGVLRFDADPARAPRISFAGDFEIRLSDTTKLRVGSSTEINLVIGTRGTGAGTFAAFSYYGVVPESVFPRFTIETNSHESGSRTNSTFDVTHRC